MAALRSGDPVRVSDRHPTARDHDTGLFYSHYRGLIGTIQKVYKGGEATVEVDLDCLPEDLWKRHMTVRDQMRQRWLAGLPDEQRRRLTPDQRELNLRYVVLVSVADLERRRIRRNRSV